VQREKERRAWTAIIETAKENKEIASAVPSEDLAIMFLLLSDATVMDTVTQKQGYDALNAMKKYWDYLYSLLKTARSRGSEYKSGRKSIFLRFEDRVIPIYRECRRRTAALLLPLYTSRGMVFLCIARRRTFFLSYYPVYVTILCLLLAEESC
jgi:hypothetical protein